jgi:hypothetical protein
MAVLQKLIDIQPPATPASGSAYDSQSSRGTAAGTPGMSRAASLGGISHASARGEGRGVMGGWQKDCGVVVAGMSPAQMSPYSSPGCVQCLVPACESCRLWLWLLIVVFVTVLTFSRGTLPILGDQDRVQHINRLRL